MKNTKNWWYMIAVIVLVSLALFVWPFHLLSGDTRSEEKGQQQINASSNTTEMQIAIDNLKNQVVSCTTGKDKIIADLQATLKEMAKKKVYVTVKPIVSGNTATPAAAVTPIKQAPQAANSTSAAKSAAPSATTATAEPLKNTAVVNIDDYAKFCVKVSGEYWPHLAINDRESFQEAIDNGIGGFDLLVKKVDAISGKYGVTKDNVAFVEKSLLDKYGSGPEIIGPKLTYGSFKKMTLQNGYYIYKQQ